MQLPNLRREPQWGAAVAARPAKPGRQTAALKIRGRLSSSPKRLWAAQLLHTVRKVAPVPETAVALLPPAVSPTVVCMLPAPTRKPVYQWPLLMLPEASRSLISRQKALQAQFGFPIRNLRPLGLHPGPPNATGCSRLEKPKKRGILPSAAGTADGVPACCQVGPTLPPQYQRQPAWPYLPCQRNSAVQC